MKKAIAVSVLAVMSLSCGQGKYDKSARINGGSMIIDVRTAKEYKEGHLKNAINIPYTEIGERIADHVKNREEKITVYCRSGRRSGIAKETLKNKGYRLVVNAGAYAKLKDQEEKNEEKENQKE